MLTASSLAEQVRLGGQWQLPCSGFNGLLNDHGVIWAGTANGTVYAFDGWTRAFVKELTCHQDAIRSMCSLTGSDAVLTGSGSCDGSIAVWASLPGSKRDAEASASPEDA